MKGFARAVVMATALLTASAASAADIVETARRAGAFGTLLAAAQAAGLVDELQGKGPLTVFAPTDEAFERLGAPLTQALLRPENREKLAAILAYHVVPGRILSGQVPTGPTEVETLNASEAELRVARRHGRVRVNGVRVAQADVLADNGVIHVIGEVLWPGELR